MIKYNLKCKNKHEFESWFSDSKEFEKLKNSKIIECIYCKTKSIEKSIALMANDYRPHMIRGDIYFNLGDYERADSKGYSKAVNLRPDLKAGWRKLTKVYKSQDRQELLIMALSRILEIDSNDERALWERAQVHFDTKKFGDAIGDIHKLLAINPGNQKARKFKAQILEKIDDKDWE